MIGIIGVGNMGGAILRGIISSGEFDLEDILVCDRHKDKQNNYKGIKFVGLSELYGRAEHIIVAVKPQSFDDVVREIGKLNDSKHIISIMAGVGVDELKTAFKTERVSLAMPNTPTLINDGMTGLSFSDNILEEDRQLTEKVFSLLGKIAEIKESDMDIFGTIAGAMPAYVFVMIDAIVDVAIKYGLKKDAAREYAAKAIMGSAHLALNSELGLSDLKSMVTSPSGTTIEGVMKLEEYGFRNAIQKAVEASTEKSKGFRN